MLLQVTSALQAADTFVSLLNEVLEHYLQHLWLWYAYGVIVLERGERDEAERAFRESIRLEPSADALVALGRLHRAAGRTDAAIECYTHALELGRNNIQAWTAMYDSPGVRANRSSTG
jgi:tetratricopeptide (TPR) repeat protein